MFGEAASTVPSRVKTCPTPSPPMPSRAVGSAPRRASAPRSSHPAAGEVVAAGVQRVVEGEQQQHGTEEQRGAGHHGREQGGAGPDGRAVSHGQPPWASSRYPTPRTVCSADAPERLVDAQPQLPDVDLDDVGVPVEREVPDVLEDPALREHLAGVPEQVLQQRELPGAQRHRDVAAPHPVPGRVEPQVPGGEHRRSRRPAPAHQRAQPGEQDDVREGLGEEVVGAGVQRLRLDVTRRSAR